MEKVYDLPKCHKTPKRSEEGPVLACNCESGSIWITFNNQAARTAKPSVKNRRLGACGVPDNRTYIIHERMKQSLPAIEDCARSSFPQENAKEPPQIEMVTVGIYNERQTRTNPSEESLHADALAADVVGLRIGNVWHPYGKIRTQVSKNGVCPSEKPDICEEWNRWKGFFSCISSYEMIHVTGVYALDSRHFPDTTEEAYRKKTGIHLKHFHIEPKLAR